MERDSVAEPKHDNKGKKHFRRDPDEDGFRRTGTSQRKGRTWKRYDPAEFEEEDDELFEEEAELESL